MGRQTTKSNLPRNQHKLVLHWAWEQNCYQNIHRTKLSHSTPQDEHHAIFFRNFSCAICIFYNHLKVSRRNNFCNSSWLFCNCQNVGRLVPNLPTNHFLDPFLIVQMFLDLCLFFHPNIRICTSTDSFWWHGGYFWKSQKDDWTSNIRSLSKSLCYSS